MIGFMNDPVGHLYRGDGMDLFKRVSGHYKGFPKKGPSHRPVKEEGCIFLGCKKLDAVLLNQWRN